MEYKHDDGVKSTAAIMGHPIHPAIISFPIAFLVGALLTDIAYAATDDGFWVRASMWLIGAGVATALLAAVFGLTDFVTIRRARRSIGWWHMGLNIAAVVISALNLYFRLNSGADYILPVGLAVSALVAGILTISGWLGGEMSFRYKIGVIGHEEDDAEEVARRRAYGAGD